MTGLFLSQYRIEAELGRGGMGIVYRATDTKLDRAVALKVLPASALASEEDRARFYREAKSAAQLHHPNIASVFQIDEAIPVDADGAQVGATDGPRPFIAMEFIEGETLADHVRKGPVRLDEAVRITTMVAEALRAAHAKNIVHRDIKSANVMLTPGGVAKVLDFGLAKTAASTQLTRQGSTLGTIAYMSPEQARGEDVDHRTDLWALGVMLYEMIAGRLPFVADYEQATLYGILNEDPEPLTALRTGVPLQLEWIVAKLLAKRPAERYQGTDDLIVDLAAVEGIERSGGLSSSRRSAVSAASIAASIAPAKPAGRGSAPRSWLWGIAGLVLGLAAASLLWYGMPADVPDPSPAVRSQILLPTGVTFEPGRAAPLAIERPGIAVSGDGARMAFVGSYGQTTAIYVREFDRPEFERIPGTEGAYGLFFSPGGRRLAFFAGDRLKIVQELRDGTVRDVVGVALPYGGVWLSDRTILYADDEGETLVRVDPSDDSRTRVRLSIEEDGRQAEAVVFYPQWELEDGRVIGVRWDGTYVLDLEKRTAERIDGTRRDPRPIASYVLVEPEGLGLSIGPAREADFRFSGRPSQLVDSLFTRSDIHQFAVSRNGTAVVARGPNLGIRRLAWVRPDGSMEILPFDPAAFGTFRLSPDGRQLAAIVHGLEHPDLWLYDLSRGTLRRLTTDIWAEHPAWTPNGDAIYLWGRDTWEPRVLRIDPGGTGGAETIAEANLSPQFVSADGKYLGVLQADGRSSVDLLYADASNLDALLPIAEHPAATEVLARLSNAGDFVAYTSSVSGNYEVYVQPFPPDGREWAVTSGGGEEPVWSADDRSIYYRYGDRLFVADVSMEGDVPTFGAPRVVLDRPFENPLGHSFDVSPVDGRVIVLVGTGDLPRITSFELITGATALMNTR